MPESFSDGVDNVLTAIHPWGRSVGEARYPYAWHQTHGRIGGNESLHAWYVRCVNDYFGGDPMRYAIEENCAAFVFIRWVEGNRLLYASCQALIVNDRTLEAFYRRGSDDVHYLRMDFNRGRLAPLFSESRPHIHITSDGEPRFPLDSLTTGNVVLDFFDFLYRNYYHRQQWREWARRVWAERAVALGLAANPFPAIEAAFQAHQVPALLSVYRPHLEQMKRAWREWKDARFPLRIDTDECNLLSYAV